MKEEDIELRLIALGVRITQCYRCGRKIFFIQTKHRRVAPVTMELTNHFIDCPKAEDFRKEEK
jgi:hypothetical protein